MDDQHRNGDVSRRAFLKLAGAGAALALAPEAGADGPKAALPQRELGRTKVRVPIVGLGTAPAGHRSRDEAVAFFHRCIDRGVTYIDTAPEFTGYGKAQVYLGHVLKERRKEVFLITKCAEPDGEFKPLSAEELARLDPPTRELARQWGNVYGAVA